MWRVRRIRYNAKLLVRCPCLLSPGSTVDSGDPKPGGVPGKTAGSLLKPDLAGQADHVPGGSPPGDTSQYDPHCRCKARCPSTKSPVCLSNHHNTSKAFPSLSSGSLSSMRRMAGPCSKSKPRVNWILSPSLARYPRSVTANESETKWEMSV